MYITVVKAWTQAIKNSELEKYKAQSLKLLTTLQLLNNLEVFAKTQQEKKKTIVSRINANKKISLWLLESIKPNKSSKANIRKIDNKNQTQNCMKQDVT